MQDLWPTNIGIEIESAPVAIMREQAELLGERTNNLVKADVEIGSTYNNRIIAYYFYIIAPTLNNYHFRLFTVEHDVEMYPLTIYVDEVLGEELGATPKMVKAVVPTNPMAQLGRTIMGANNNEREPARHFIMPSSEDEFINNLKEILGSQRSRQVISSLLSQVNASHEHHAS